jgi:hypothetical protein
VYADLTQLRLTRMHARVGAAIRRLRPGDVSALAHHYLRAASADSAEAAVGYAIKAAERADRRYAYDAAVWMLEQALEAFARTPGSESERAEQQADLLGRLLRAQIRAGRIAAARATRQRAADAAASAGRDDLVTAAFAAWTEPTPWQTRPYGVVDEQAVTTLERQLERSDQDQATRCRLLAALVAELAGEDDPRPARAAAEAEAIARRLGGPDLLALALTAGTMVVNYEQEPERRAVLAAELGPPPLRGGHRADAAQRVAARRRLSRAGAADHRAQRGACGRGRTARPRAARDDRPPAHGRLGGDAGGGRPDRRGPPPLLRRRRAPPCDQISSTPSSPRSGPWRSSPWATAPRPRHSSPT